MNTLDQLSPSSLYSARSSRGWFKGASKRWAPHHYRSALGAPHTGNGDVEQQLTALRLVNSQKTRQRDNPHPVRTLCMTRLPALNPGLKHRRDGETELTETPMEASAGPDSIQPARLKSEISRSVQRQPTI